MALRTLLLRRLGPWLLLAAAWQSHAAASPGSEGLTDADRQQLVRSVQLAHWLELDEDLPVALCVQQASPRWPEGTPDARQLDRWRQDWDGCASQWHRAGEDLRLVAEARQRLQQQVQRLQRVWSERSACRDAVSPRTGLNEACLAAVWGRSPSPDERRWLLLPVIAAPAGKSSR